MAISAPPAGATNAELIRWSFDALNRHDLDALRAVWTDATVERFPQETRVGTEAIADYFAAFLASVPDAHFEPQGLAADGEDVFVRWHLTGTFSGAPFRGLAATGATLGVDGVDHFVVRDGRVASNFIIMDQMQFARQIGMLPEEDTSADKGLKAVFNARTKVAAKARARRA